VLISQLPFLKIIQLLRSLQSVFILPQQAQYCGYWRNGYCPRVVYGTAPNPTIALTTKTSDGTGVGSFVSSLTGLLFGQDYYVRSYSITSKGVLYGNQVTFTTLTPNIPTPVVPNGTFELPVITGFVMNPQPNVWSFSGGGVSRKTEVPLVPKQLLRGFKPDYCKGTHRCIRHSLLQPNIWESV